MYTRSFLFLCALVVVVAALLAYMRGQITTTAPTGGVEKQLVHFNDKTPLSVTVVSDPQDRARGLSGRTVLEPTEGMLFVFPGDGYHGIWMKEMFIPLDIVWVSADGVIVDRVVNAQPDSFPQVFEPKTPARYVIEMNAYFTETFAIKIGDRVALPDTLRTNLR